eukprot:scaffold33697_cov34-Attheya_sp.AAC.1
MEITRVPHYFSPIPTTTCPHFIKTHHHDIREGSYELRGAFCINSKIRGTTILARILNSGEHPLFFQYYKHARQELYFWNTALQSTTKAPYQYPPGPYTQFLENSQSQIGPSMTLSPFQYVLAAVAYYDSTDWVESIMHVLSTTASSDLDPLMQKHASSYHLQGLVL